VRFPHPGGCVLGKRPIDFFLAGFKKMGAQVEETDEYYDITVDGKLRGCTYFFPRISHTATESLMMTATLAEGTTILKNAACEPEIVALADYLNAHGAKISGAGTHTITIEGVDSLTAGDYQTIPDRLEAGTFAILGAMIADKLTITRCNPSHLEALWHVFDRMGVRYELGEDTVTVWGGDNYTPVDIQTHEYPGFATDIQPPMTMLLTQCRGKSMVHETIFEGRLFYTDLLKQMGADITMCDPHRVVIDGPTPLYGRKIASPDIRAGMALVMAALIAEGESIIGNVYQVERGYADLAQRLQAIGADIIRKET
jgi:UDP-N-acetylglucosamine 1-carboxyvinyltransferase